MPRFDSMTAIDGVVTALPSRRSTSSFSRRARLARPRRNSPSTSIPNTIYPDSQSVVVASGSKMITIKNVKRSITATPVVAVDSESATASIFDDDLGSATPIDAEAASIVPALRQEKKNSRRTTPTFLSAHAHHLQRKRAHIAHSLGKRQRHSIHSSSMGLISLAAVTSLAPVALPTSKAKSESPALSIPLPSATLAPVQLVPATTGLGYTNAKNRARNINSSKRVQHATRKHHRHHHTTIVSPTSTVARRDVEHGKWRLLA